MNSKQSAGILLYRLEAVPDAADAGPNAAPTAAVGPDTAADGGPTAAAVSGLPPSAGPEVLLVHPGGPFWKHRHAGSWTIPKGEFDNDEPALDAAVREFREETGFSLKGYFQPLSPIRQKGGKRVFAWAIAGDLDPAAIVSNTFELEWPRHSGRLQAFPEVDKGGWFSLTEARRLIIPAQIPLLDELEATIGQR